MLLEKASKTDLIRFFSNLSMEGLIQYKYPTLGTCIRVYNTEKIERVLAVLILDLAASFEVEFDEDQVNEITTEITSGILINLSFEDVYFVFRKMKYSDQYGKLDLNKILKALDAHLNKRSGIIMSANYNKHLSIRENAPVSSTAAELTEAFTYKHKKPAK